MKRNRLLWSLFAVAAMSSCVDNNYELADIDTTVGIEVKDLTIPLNVEDLDLEQVIDLEESSQVKKCTLNGKEIYALVEEGTFKSEAIEIPGFTAKGPEIEPIKTELGKSENAVKHFARGAARNADEPVCTYTITNVGTSFDFSGKVDAAVKDIQRIAVEAMYRMSFDVSQNKFFQEYINKISFENLTAKLPSGFEGEITITTIQNGEEKKFVISECYDPATGILSNIPEGCLSTDNGFLTLEVKIHAINLNSATQANALKGRSPRSSELVFKDGMFYFKGDVMVNEGQVAIYSDKEDFTIEDIPETIDYVCTPELDEIVVREVSGDVEYAIDGINIAPVTMNDIPDMLGQDETNIILAKPQIYLRLNNPLADNNLRAEAGLKLTAIRNKGANKEANSEILNIDKADNIFCLTTSMDFPRNELQAGYEDAEIQVFNGFDEILSGAGLPDEIKIDVVNPQIPRQTIANFELDQNIEAIEGSYMLFAPFALKDASSCIVYRDTIKDWHDETLDKLEISAIKVRANAVSEVPLALELSIYPIDVKGNIIAGVETETVEIAATANAQELDIDIIGEIKHLDGVVLNAKLKGSNGEPISPAHKLKLQNLKISVSGQYIDEL